MCVHTCVCVCVHFSSLLHGFLSMKAQPFCVLPFFKYTHPIIFFNTFRFITLVLVIDRLHKTSVCQFDRGEICNTES